MTTIQLLAAIALTHLVLYMCITRWAFKWWSWSMKWTTFWLHTFWVWALPPVVGVVLLFIPGMRIFGVLLIAVRVLHWMLIQLLDSIHETTASTFPRTRKIARYGEVAYEMLLMLLIIMKG